MCKYKIMPHLIFVAILLCKMHKSLFSSNRQENFLQNICAQWKRRSNKLKDEAR